MQNINNSSLYNFCYDICFTGGLGNFDLEGEIFSLSFVETVAATMWVEYRIACGGTAWVSATSRGMVEDETVWTMAGPIINSVVTVLWLYILDRSLLDILAPKRIADSEVLLVVDLEIGLYILSLSLCFTSYFGLYFCQFKA